MRSGSRSVTGLEFEHALILDASEHDANFDVAVTRPTKSLTVCSRDPVISFGGHLFRRLLSAQRGRRYDRTGSHSDRLEEARGVFGVGVPRLRETLANVSRTGPFTRLPG